MPDTLFKIEPKNIKEIIDKGYSDLTLPGGDVVTITKEDLVFLKTDIQDFVEKIQSGSGFLH